MDKINLHNCSVGEMWCNDIICSFPIDYKKQDMLFRERYAPDFEFISAFALSILGFVMVWPAIVHFIIIKLFISCLLSYMFTEQTVKKLSFDERKLRFELYREVLKIFVTDSTTYSQIVDLTTTLQWTKKKPLENRPKWLSYVLTCLFFLLLSIF